MDRRFADLIESLQPSFERLIGCDPHSGSSRLPLDVPRRAVYLFSEGGRHLYVGRTNRLRDRHREHWSGKHNDAPFAFKLARRGDDGWLNGNQTRGALAGFADFAGVR